jgi:hypothetical protein
MGWGAEEFSTSQAVPCELIDYVKPFTDSYSIIHQNHIQGLFWEEFSIENNMDFAIHIPPTKDMSDHFVNGEDTNGPNMDDLHFDMRGEASSEWNQTISECSWKP